MLTSATATINSSLSAFSVGSNTTLRVIVSTVGTGSRSPGGVYTPQASSLISSGQRRNFEWAVGFLVFWFFLLPWEAFCDRSIIGLSMNWYAALLNEHEMNFSIYPYLHIPIHNSVTQVVHWGRESYSH